MAEQPNATPAPTPTPLPPIQQLLPPRFALPFPLRVDMTNAVSGTVPSEFPDGHPDAPGRMETTTREQRLTSADGQEVRRTDLESWAHWDGRPSRPILHSITIDDGSRTIYWARYEWGLEMLQLMDKESDAVYMAESIDGVLSYSLYVPNSGGFMAISREEFLKVAKERAGEEWAGKLARTLPKPLTQTVAEELPRGPLTTIAIRTDGKCAVIAPIEAGKTEFAGKLHVPAGDNKAAESIKLAHFKPDMLFVGGRDPSALALLKDDKALRSALPPEVYSDLLKSFESGTSIRIQHVDRIEACPATPVKPAAKPAQAKPTPGKS